MYSCPCKYQHLQNTIFRVTVSLFSPCIKAAKMEIKLMSFPFSPCPHLIFRQQGILCTERWRKVDPLWHLHLQSHLVYFLQTSIRKGDSWNSWWIPIGVVVVNPTELDIRKVQHTCTHHLGHLYSSLSYWTQEGIYGFPFLTLSTLKASLAD